MIQLNGKAFLDYNETALALNCTNQYVAILVNRGRLKSISIAKHNRKYIALNDVKARLITLKKDMTVLNNYENSLTVNNSSSISPIVHSETMETLDKVNDTVKAMYESYEKIVQPLVKTIADTAQKQFNETMAKFAQQVLNRVYNLPEKFYETMSIEEFTDYVFQDTDMPEYVKQRIIELAKEKRKT